MRLHIIGGRLQGVEACTLAMDLPLSVTLVDLDPSVPARGLCDSFVRADITGPGDLDCVLKDAEMVLPALEDHETLRVLDDWCSRRRVPLLFDLPSFLVTSSKSASNDLFTRAAIPIPEPWPGCGFPVVVKPDGESGSRGVRMCETEETLQGVLKEFSPDEPPVVQRYIPGRHLSLEVVGTPGSYRPLQTTELKMDDVHDCRRVIAPAEVCEDVIHDLERYALLAAERLQLRGLMDIEAILEESPGGNGGLRVLEIDARLPSQTPLAVRASGGMHMLAALIGSFLPDKKQDLETAGKQSGEGWAVLEHLKVSGGGVTFAGEHIMKDAGSLSVIPGFFGADEGITDYARGKESWVATIIVRGRDRREVLNRRQRVIDAIAREIGGGAYRG